MSSYIRSDWECLHCFTESKGVGLASSSSRYPTTVRLVGNLFVVMTSLVLGFMINSAKNK